MTIVDGGFSIWIMQIEIVNSVEDSRTQSTTKMPSVADSYGPKIKLGMSHISQVFRA